MRTRFHVHPNIEDWLIDLQSAGTRYDTVEGPVDLEVVIDVDEFPLKTCP